MIVRAIGGELWLFDQWEHSAMCGPMAAAWGAPPWTPVPDAVQVAAATHDAGWRVWDVLPRLDPATGRPHPYSHMPPDEYREIWRRGLAAAVDKGDEVGLLVSLHAMRFFARREDHADRELFRSEQSRQRAALERLGAGAPPDGVPEPFATWHAWIFFWDALSLFLCEGWSSPWSSPVPTGEGGEVEVVAERSPPEAMEGRVTLRPNPFREELRLTAMARVIPDAGYAGQEALDRAVRAADLRETTWIVAGG